MFDFTEEMLRNVCMSYRHDFPLLEPEEQENLICEARSWGESWEKEIEWRKGLSGTH